MSQKIKTYKATLVRKFKDRDSLSPKILLTDVVDTKKDKLFRDHCWVNDNPRFNGLLDDKDSVEITFTAKVYSYTGSNGKNKSLKQIRNVNIVGD